MGARFRIRVGEEECVCELIEDEAPNVCEAFRKALPARSFAVHAKFAEEELIVMLPLWAEAENFIPDGNRQGDVSYYTNRQTLCLFYGHVTPFGKPGNAFAKLIDGQDAMKRAARTVLEKGILPAEIFLEGEQRAEAALPAPAGRSDFSAKANSFLKESWAAEPADIRTLRGFSRPLMGNMPCVLYACFDLFWATENLQVCREKAREESMALRDLNPMTAALLDRARKRLAHWGMQETVGLLATGAEHFTSTGPATTEEYLAETQDLILAIDTIQRWIDAIIPWSKLDQSLTLSEVPRPTDGPAVTDR